LDGEAFKFLLKHERIKYPREFNGFFFYYSNLEEEERFLSEVYWLKALEYDPWITCCEVKVDANNVVISSGSAANIEGGIKEARLYLNDEIVDLDEPVRVELYGKEVFNREVERSVEFLMDWFEDQRDPRRLFWNAIEIEI